jgi:hypothetical protein
MQYGRSQDILQGLDHLWKRKSKFNVRNVRNENDNGFGVWHFHESPDTTLTGSSCCDMTHRHTQSLLHLARYRTSTIEKN